MFTAPSGTEVNVQYHICTISSHLRPPRLSPPAGGKEFVAINIVEVLPKARMETQIVRTITVYYSTHRSTM